MPDPEKYRQKLLAGIKPHEEEKVKALAVEGAFKKDEADQISEELALIKGLVLPSMRLIGERQVPNKEANIKVRLQFSLAVSAGATGGNQIGQLVDCFGSQAKGWYRENTVIQYSLTEEGEQFRDKASVEDLFRALECLTLTAKEPRAPAVYYEPITRSGRK